ncbi:MAG: hypothetical protein QMD66_02630 [Actinomycetota bacterium]|nr:hypothetical protein [Actinomycetota bacterium]
MLKKRVGASPMKTFEQIHSFIARRDPSGPEGLVSLANRVNGLNCACPVDATAFFGVFSEHFTPTIVLTHLVKYILVDR